MKKINLSKPWIYRTPLVTIDYGSGVHEVTNEIAAAAEAAGAIEGTTDGNGPAKTGAKGAADKAEG